MSEGIQTFSPSTHMFNDFVLKFGIFDGWFFALMYSRRMKSIKVVTYCADGFAFDQLFSSSQSSPSSI
jgi:hypothetical protein